MSNRCHSHVGAMAHLHLCNVMTRLHLSNAIGPVYLSNVIGYWALSNRELAYPTAAKCELTDLSYVGYTKAMLAIG